LEAAVKVAELEPHRALQLVEGVTPGSRRDAAVERIFAVGNFVDCRQIRNVSSREKCTALRRRPFLAGMNDAMVVLDGDRGTAPGSEPSDGGCAAQKRPLRDPCYAWMATSLESALKRNEACARIVKFETRAQCMHDLGESLRSSERVAAARAECDALSSEAGAADCRYRLSESAIHSTVEMRMELCRAAAPFTRRCISRLMKQVSIETVYQRPPESSFVNLVTLLEERQAVFQTLIPNIVTSRRDGQHRMLRQVFITLLDQITDPGDLASWRGMADAFEVDDVRRAIWTDALATVWVRRRWLPDTELQAETVPPQFDALSTRFRQEVLELQVPQHSPTEPLPLSTEGDVIPITPGAGLRSPPHILRAAKSEGPYGRSRLMAALVYGLLEPRTPPEIVRSLLSDAWSSDAAETRLIGLEFAYYRVVFPLHRSPPDRDWILERSLEMSASDPDARVRQCAAVVAASISGAKKKRTQALDAACYPAGPAATSTP
jgi:hypothetical protein